jgi:hypothetical protein
MPQAQLWSCRGCGLRQALVFERGAPAQQRAPFTILPCASCESIHHIALPEDADRESVRVAVVRPEVPPASCAQCAAPSLQVHAGGVAMGLCEQGHERPLPEVG